MALAREVERRAPDIATSKWWKEERHGVFVDYNQNAKDRTTASAYSVRPSRDARVSTPLRWDEVADCDPAIFTIDSVPARFAALGDPAAGIDAQRGSIEALLALAERDAAAGLAEAPLAGRGAARRRRASPSGRPVAAGRRRRSSRSRAPRPRPRRWPGSSAGSSAIRDVWAHLEPSDVLVDTMRGRSTTWTRIRVNLRNVPAAPARRRKPWRSTTTPGPASPGQIEAESVVGWSDTRAGEASLERGVIGLAAVREVRGKDDGAFVQYAGLAQVLSEIDYLVETEMVVVTGGTPERRVEDRRIQMTFLQ